LKFKNQKGSQSIEMLIVLPLLLMMFFMIVEMGFVMYDFVSVNYVANSMAVQAATTGEFTDVIKTSGANYLRDWTVGGKNLNVSYAQSPLQQQGTIVIWGPESGTKFNRGQTITVGVVYPVQYKTFIMQGMAWLVNQQELYLKAQASAASEVYIE